MGTQMQMQNKGIMNESEASVVSVTFSWRVNLLSFAVDAPSEGLWR